MMAPKLRPDAIGVDEMKCFLETESDFDFELRVLHKLRELNLDCEHGGHYEDPVTKKSREFDIRMRVRGEGNLHLLAAIECKNLRQNFPLLISCVPRTRDEAWHEMVRSDYGSSVVSAGQRVTSDSGLYRLGDWVGKSTIQVGVTPQGEMITNDGEVYEKWGQCLSSLHCFVQEIPTLSANGGATMALPILVVPDGRLWQVRYNTDGSRVADPEQVDRCAVYAGGFSIPFGRFETRIGISHVEVITFGGLMRFCRQRLGDERTMRALIFGHP